MKKRERSSKSLPLKDVIEEYLKRNPIGDHYYDSFITSCWPKIVGPTIANRTSKIYIRNGILYLTIDLPVLANEINMSKDRLRELLNQETGQNTVKEIVVYSKPFK